MSDTGSKRLCLGVITGAHGIKGEVVIKSFTADPLDINAYGPLSDADGGREILITSAKPSQKGVIAGIRGVSDRNAAEALKGRELFIDRSRLPETDDEEEFYYTDLVGLVAETSDGSPFGEVVALHDFGAGDLIEIRPSTGGKTLIFPFTRQTVPSIDLDAGRLVVNPPEEVEASGPDGNSEPG